MKKNKVNKEHNYKEGYNAACGNHLLGIIMSNVSLIDSDMAIKDVEWNKGSFLKLSIFGDTEAKIIVNKYKKSEAIEWEFVYLVVASILGLNLYKKINKTDEYYLAITLFGIHYVRNIMGNDNIPSEWFDFYMAEKDLSFKNEESIYEQLIANKALFNKYSHINLLVGTLKDTIEINSLSKSKSSYGFFGNYNKTFNEVFGENLVKQAQRTIALSANRTVTVDENSNLESYKAKRWFLNHYPLLAGIIVQFKIVEDIKECQKRDIKIGAVSAIEKTIYINPLAQLNEQGMRFVIAHEILHIALNHHSRRYGRDKLAWNLACDFVINHWLVQMGIGVPPQYIYSDPSLNRKSADEIYLMITQDSRIKKKLGTLKNLDAGANKKSSASDCDMLDEDPKYFADFEDACKNSLLRGVFLHQSIGRGDLPSDLVEEIKFINQPPIPWQVELADWIAEKFPALENRRTYTRLSRRQNSTPDIPRASYVKPEEDRMKRTYGVIIDTSGSVSRELLAKSIGAVVSYSQAQDIEFIRLIFCDALAYDEGYVPIDLLLKKISVKGRGGTVLQPAVNVLENALDFPADAPILIISDGYFENDLIIKREHAFLVPNKLYIPFTPVGKVFEFEKN